MSVGAPDWAGTRLLHGNVQVLNKVQNSLAPGGSDTYTVPVTRPGYILEIHLFNATDNVTKLPVGIQMRWLDGQSGDNLDTQGWITTAGTVVGPHYVDGSGPTKGGQLEVTINNLASSGPSLGYFLLINETSFAYVRHDWRTDDVFSFNPTGWTAAVSDINVGVLWAENGFSVGANSSVSFIAPLYNGPVYVRFGTTAAAGNMEVEADLSPYGGTIGAQAAWDFFTDANGQISQLAYQPRIQCVYTFTNHTAAALQLFGSICIAER